MSRDHFQVPGFWLPALGSRHGNLLVRACSTHGNTEAQCLVEQALGVRATPRCSPLLPGEEEPEASAEGSSEGPGRCNPRRVTRSEHGLGWTFPTSCPSPRLLGME